MHELKNPLAAEKQNDDWNFYDINL